jgi:hypothetical protein
MRDLEFGAGWCGNLDRAYLIFLPREEEERRKTPATLTNDTNDLHYVLLRERDMSSRLEECVL